MGWLCAYGRFLQVYLGTGFALRESYITLISLVWISFPSGFLVAGFRGQANALDFGPKYSDSFAVVGV